MAPSKTRGYIFIGLNAVRVLSIIALLLLFASSIVTLVQDIKAVNAFIAEGSHQDILVSSGNSTETVDCSDMDYVPGSTVPNQPAGAFWAVLNRLLIIFQVIVLVMSEVGWPATFFSRFFPILGDDFGLGALGVIQCLLGAAVLSHHVDEFSLVSAFFLFSIGCLNILLGLIFREKAKPRRAIKAWKETDEVLPRTSLRSGPRPFLTSTSTGSTNPVAPWDEKGADAARSGTLLSQRSGMGFGRQGEKAALARGHTVTTPEATLPQYVPRATATLSPAPTYVSRTVRYAAPEPEPEADEDGRRSSGVSYASAEGTPRAV
ncbi:uncharacterized protein B0H18DRAFT_911174 [Fomitopsis serialis]|uniref:uncharacterized protein n=1 Tax=Fomitopsis serialis TaxID=139415 RepID=UPI0020080711|nr:uncharacterized protein B0H18DRAFT_911174 [Neoantrodia serialis]KAH9921125.1 hypothetical protein B0H18DRAFT_911174 [Neoantrodia serialis]